MNKRTNLIALCMIGCVTGCASGTPGTLGDRNGDSATDSTNGNAGSDGDTNSDTGDTGVGPLCGNGVIEDGEACDDGNLVTEACGYGEQACLICNSTCQMVEGDTSFCGDGRVDTAMGEGCDDLNTVTEDCGYGLTSCVVCTASCVFGDGETRFCGDGVVGEADGEVCDDGNEVVEDCPYGEECFTCGPSCRYVAGGSTFCGDGVVQSDALETCDSGSANSDTGLCGSDCRLTGLFAGPCSLAADLDGNATIDRAAEWTYDLAGRTLTQEQFDNTLSRLVFEQSEYNERGQRVSYTRDSQGDNVIDYREAATYALGAMLTYSVDQDNSGSTDYGLAYTYNDGRQLTLIQTDGRAAPVYGADGQWDVQTEYTYDAQGYLLTEEKLNILTGEVASRIVYAHDDNGLPIQIVWDSNGDGIDELVFDYTYDSRGNMIGGTADWDIDGTIDFRETRRYDLEGRLIANELDGDPTTYRGFDGTVDLYEFRVYDVQGNWTEHTYRDGTNMLLSHAVATYDEAGNRLRYERDQDGDGAVDESEVNAYDSRGNRTAYLFDMDGDNTIDYQWTQTYTANDWPLVLDVDGDSEAGGADGVFDYNETNTYDAAGNHLSMRVDADGDGDTEEAYVFDYSCWL